MLDKTLISNIEKVFFVDNDPFPNAIINNFLPIEVAKKAEDEFLNYGKSVDAGNMRYQKTKMHNKLQHNTCYACSDCQNATRFSSLCARR